MKKFVTALLFFALVFALTACNGGGGGTSEGGGTAAPTEGGDTAAPTEGGDTAAPTEGGDTAPPPVSSLPTEAQDFEFVALSFNCREFDVGDSGAEVFIGDNMNSKRNGAKDAIKQAFQQEDEADPESEYVDHRFLICQNGDFWSNVSHITATLYLDDVGGGGDPVDFAWWEPYIQLGGGVDHYFDFIGMNIIEQFDETGGFGFGSDYVATITWPINDFWKEHGTLDIAADDDGGGLLKFGTKMRNDGLDAYTLKVNWTSVEVFVYDEAKFMDYVDRVTEINGVVMSDNAKVTQVG
ncbi:MAG: hypothetical protein LBI38_03825 [Oscillospiraceae bacterium]|jgi:hypothetical protein|nr:hypothetical protein [Oscillospiraceae bacterium]